VFLSRHPRKSLLDGLSIDAPYVTEVRRLLQSLYRQQKSAPKEVRSYMVTSAGKGEGKSTICALMAIISAKIFHKRTLLLDGDLHRPTIHGLLGVGRGPGLFEVFRRGAPVQTAIHTTALPLLWAIPSGYAREASGEAYADEEFNRLLQQMYPSYDVIFVDAPPVVPAIEPILMAEHVDAVLVVAMAGKTPLTMVRRSMQVLAPVKEKIVGVVLNNAMEGLPYYFSYSYYGYDETKPRSRRSLRPGLPRPKGIDRTKDTRGGT
jgi:capsular exopolysaccharide synthesis family protein